MHLRSEVELLCKKYNTKLILAPLEFCSDNAAMIGRVAVEQYKKEEFISYIDIDVKARLNEF
jgi:N6-L-threonylcarbamoyladenine synthase